MRKGLFQTLFTGRNLIKTESTASTNTYAHELVANSEPIEGTAIMAEYQQHGKGQRGNNWISEYGSNLLVSFIFYPKFLEPKNQFYLNIVAALAVAKTLVFYNAAKISIKWPNDIYSGNRKIAGILIENIVRGNKITATVIGIGININQVSFPDFVVPAASLAGLGGNEFNKHEVFEELCNNLEKYYLSLKSGKQNLLKQRYMQMLFRKDEFHNYESNGAAFRGRIISVIDDGKLLLETEEGKEKLFDFKEIKFLV